MTTPMMPEPGETLHWLATGYMFHTITRGQHMAFVSRRGDELMVTQDLIDANKDRNGVLAPWLRLLHDEAAQVQRFGQQIVAAGSWPKHLLATVPGEPEHEDARRAALQDARQIKDPAERRAAEQAVGELFGPAPATSRTVGVYAGDRQ